METKYDPEDETLQLLRDLLPVEVRQPPAWSAGGKTRVVLVVAHCRAQGRAALIRVGTGLGQGSDRTHSTSLHAVSVGGRLL